MATKLRFVSGRIPWSLAVKAVVAGGLWLIAPYPLFFLAALAAYFFPSFQAVAFAFPFVVFLGVAAVVGKSVLAAFSLAVLLFLLLGVKDLVFVNRRAAYAALLYFLLFLLFLTFFARVSAWRSVVPFAGALVVGVLFYFLAKGFFDYVGVGDVPPLRRLALAIAALLVWQTSWALFFLPFTFVSQAALLFLVGAVLLELSADYLAGAISLRRLVRFLLVLALVVLFLGATTEWRP